MSLCGKELSLAGFDDLAREAYLKMDDFANVLALYVKNQVGFEVYRARRYQLCAPLYCITSFEGDEDVQIVAVVVTI